MFVDVFSLRRWRFTEFLESDLEIRFLVVLYQTVYGYMASVMYGTLVGWCWEGDHIATPSTHGLA